MSPLGGHVFFKLECSRGTSFLTWSWTPLDAMMITKATAHKTFAANKEFPKRANVRRQRDGYQGNSAQNVRERNARYVFWFQYRILCNWKKQ